MIKKVYADFILDDSWRTTLEVTPESNRRICGLNFDWVKCESDPDVYKQIIHLTEMKMKLKHNMYGLNLNDYNIEFYEQIYDENDSNKVVREKKINMPHYWKYYEEM